MRERHQEPWEQKGNVTDETQQVHPSDQRSSSDVTSRGSFLSQIPRLTTPRNARSKVRFSLANNSNYYCDRKDDIENEPCSLWWTRKELETIRCKSNRRLLKFKNDIFIFSTAQSSSKGCDDGGHEDGGILSLLLAHSSLPIVNGNGKKKGKADCVGEEDGLGEIRGLESHLVDQWRLQQKQHISNVLIKQCKLLAKREEKRRKKSKALSSSSSSSSSPSTKHPPNVPVATEQFEFMEKLSQQSMKSSRGARYRAHIFGMADAVMANDDITELS